jgi:protein-L-isoaspartate(D-aspartate) O-methyltransferase
MRWRRLRPGLHRLHGREPAAAARERMVHQQIEARGLTDPQLLHAFRIVPRHLFVEDAGAYSDRALPLAAGQTISQPYVVAVMTDASRPPNGWPDANVLEIGTGSGYQAAILAELGARVTSIERHAELAAEAQKRLRAAGYGSVRVVVGDGTRGDAEGAPWDVVLVTAGGPSVPQPLLEQLEPDGGRLVMPVGTRRHQAIVLVERRGSELLSRQLEPVAFVPLLGAFGFPDDFGNETDEADDSAAPPPPGEPRT